MRFSKVHVNALIGLVLHALLTAALVLLAWGLTADFVSTNGAYEIKYLLIGALLPTIGTAMDRLASVVRRFTYMGDKEKNE